MATYPYRPEVDDEPALSPWLIRLPLLVISGAVLLTLLLVMFLAVFQIQYRGKIVPNVSAYGVQLGGMTEAQAADALSQQFSADNQRTFTFRDGDQTWSLSGVELGISFDAAATAREAARVGRGGNFIDNTIDQLLTWLNGDAITPVITYDQNVALDHLNQIANTINRFPTDASLQIIGTDVQITPGSVGRTMNVMATLGRLDSAILDSGSAASSGVEIPIAIAETPPVVADVDEAAARARIALSGPLTLVADDGNGTQLGPWTASVEQIAQLLRVSTVQGTDGALHYQVDVNMGAFAPYLRTLAAGLIVSPEDGRFHFNEETHQLELIQASRSGRALNIEQTIAAMQAAVFSTNNRIVPLQFDYQLPTYHDNVTAAELGITELLSRGVSYYTGSSQARIDNIIRAASRFDGVMIGPGEVFSFDRYVGDISPEEGYVQSAVIYGDRTIQGVGGGVCQVSTTAFRAAFYAGYPFYEWHSHSYRVGYYEHGDPEGVGMDTAIYVDSQGPDLDFQFVNDTPYHLLIETSIYPANNSIEFRFYSTNPGRQVIKQGPEIRDIREPAPTRYEVNPDLTLGQERMVDFAAQGAYVEVTRIILDSSGNEIRREVFARNYEPWGTIVQVAPGDPRAS
ncbi:MAG: VanW family protein [Anaerolineae bacterium]